MVPDVGLSVIDGACAVAGIGVISQLAQTELATPRATTTTMEIRNLSAVMLPSDRPVARHVHQRPPGGVTNCEKSVKAGRNITDRRPHVGREGRPCYARGGERTKSRRGSTASRCTCSRQRATLA